MKRLTHLLASASFSATVLGVALCVAQVSKASEDNSYGKVEINAPEDNDSSAYELVIKITSQKTKEYLTILPGEYQFEPGNYDVEIFRAEPDSIKPTANYQLIQDKLSVTNSQALHRTYKLPQRRRRSTARYHLTISPYAGYIANSYQVPSWAYAYDAQFNSENNNKSKLADFGEMTDSNAIGGIQTYLAYLFKDSSWLIQQETALGYTVSSTPLRRVMASGGLGLYRVVNNVTYWMSGGIGGDKVQWEEVAISGNSGTAQVTDTTGHVFGYGQLGLARTKGGFQLSARVEYPMGIATLQLGWNFGGESLKYDLPAVTSECCQ